MILLIVYTHTCTCNNTHGTSDLYVIQNEEIALWAAMISYDIMVLWISLNVLHCMYCKGTVTLFY